MISRLMTRMGATFPHPVLNMESPLGGIKKPTNLTFLLSQVGRTRGLDFDQTIILMTDYSALNFIKLPLYSLSLLHDMTSYHIIS